LLIDESAAVINLIDDGGALINRRPGYVTSTRYRGWY